MKSLKQIIHISVLSSILILPSLSFAGGAWIGRNIIISIGINDGRILVNGNSRGVNPDTCTKTTPLILPADMNGYSEFYALLVASYLQNKAVNFRISGCMPLYLYGDTYPIIHLVASYHNL